ncbi:MAG: hypothetical protein JW807_00500 [Spirochaetes bacterium]|nr:hypothetical protein [Spirochaetota bacterium]
MNRIAIISPDASVEILKNLRALDIEPIAIPRTDRVSPQISGHPDIQLFLHAGRFYCHPDISPSFLNEIERYAETVICPTRLDRHYPADIPYNIACVGSVALHHHTHIDPLVSSILQSELIKTIGVSQGYVKCSTLIVDDRSIITADSSINQAALAAGLSSLVIRPGAIDLPGHAYGFIGGATGLAEDTMLCTGTLRFHPDYEPILRYISERGKRLVSLSKSRAVDLGTIYIF